MTDAAFHEALGRRILAMRKCRDWTQKQLAARVGISFQMVQKHETGQSAMTAARLWAFAQAFGEPVEALFPVRSDREPEPRHNGSTPA